MTITVSDVVQLKAKILSADFSPDERALIVDALNLGNYAGGHEYPPRHGPGSSPWATKAWAILDLLTPGKLRRRDRFMLAGMIAGALYETYETGRRDALMADSET